MSKKLYVGNLSYNVSDESFEAKFAEFGELVSARIVKDRHTGRSKGFGFVEYNSEDIAGQVIEKLNGAEFEGRALNISIANERSADDRPRSSFRDTAQGGRRDGGFGGGGRGGFNRGNR